MIGSLSTRTNLTALIENKKLPNALILSGDNGIGKTSMAYALALEIMCGCGEPDCEICKEITEQLWEYRDRALTGVYEFDLGKNRDDNYVDNVLDVFRISGKKVIILDEIQNLSQMNMTKFLKSFERVEEDTYVIICTTELYKLNTGIVSRCEVFELTPPNTLELASYLETICRLEHVEHSREAIYIIAKMKYRVRDAISSLETIININGRVTAEGVREYFGKSNYDYPTKYLTACKNTSPYALLFLLKEIKEDIGLYKFTVALKEMLVDAIYARYGISPLFMNEAESAELRKVISNFTTEEITEILRDVGRLQNRSNLDREIILINLGFALSNGSLLKKVSLDEEKKVSKATQEQNMLSDNVSLVKSVDSLNGFTLETQSEINDEVVEKSTRIVDAPEILGQLNNIFGYDGGEIDDSES